MTRPLTRRLACTALCALAAALPTQAAEHFCGRATPHPIDQRLAAASQSGVTVELLSAQDAAYTAWDKELNRVYAALLKHAGPERREALRSAQRAWLAFDKAQGQWDMVLLADQGSSSALNVQGAALERRRARVCTLSDDLQGLQDTQ